MNVALMGSVSSSWYALDALIRGEVEVTGVLGVDESRAEHVSDYRSLRERGGDAGIPFHSFVKVSEPGVEAFLMDHAPDLLWVIGLSQLVPDRLMAIARIGGVGFHPTMLPEGRGRAPVAWTILRGARAAANLFFLTDEPDGGDIIIQREVPVLPDDYSEDLIERTNRVLADAILELAPRICAGDVPRTPQDHSKASYYPKRTPADGLIDWAESTEAIYRLIRAAGRPYRGAFTRHQQQRLTVWRGRPSEACAAGGSGRPGSVLSVSRSTGIAVATGDGAILMTEVEAESGDEASDVLQVGALLS
ncbi:MAG: methionyl-tRNA formyltransferase [Planctomycetes bacterium]|nr:methionyl-tRNA formyltransferase [Planctomycetota bacterium]